MFEPVSSIYVTGSSFEPAALSSQTPEPDWRAFAVQKLQRYGLKVVNPLELSWYLNQADDAHEKQVRHALDLIDQCDALLANLERSSYGTAMEMFYAYQRGKMVTVVGQSPFSPWVLANSQARFAQMEQALDYLIGEQPSLDAVSYTLQYEGLLSEHYEQMPPEGEPDYIFLGGDLPVLVIAPHATAYFKDGEFQEADTFTGAIAAFLNKKARCHSLFSFYCCLADPCTYLDTPMRRAAIDIIKAGDIGLVILLLGNGGGNTPGLAVNSYEPLGMTSPDYASGLKLLLSQLEPVADFSQQPPDPMVKFIAHDLQVPVISVQTHKRYRMPRLQPEHFSRLVDKISAFTLQTGNDLQRSHN